MQNFLGNKCPYCGKNFTAEDNIVVCPECGTPHHRDCYKEHSACANEEKHGENFEWKNAAVPPVHKHEPAGQENGGITVCPNCGRENPGISCCMQRTPGKRGCGRAKSRVQFHPSDAQPGICEAG